MRGFHNSILRCFFHCSGISSLVFTREAEALYLHSSSEIQRISLATSGVTSARCYLALPEGARDDAASETNDADGEKQEENGAPLVNGNSESKESSVADKV